MAATGAGVEATEEVAIEVEEIGIAVDAMDEGSEIGIAAHVKIAEIAVLGTAEAMPPSRLRNEHPKARPKFRMLFRSEIEAMATRTSTPGLDQEGNRNEAGGSAEFIPQRRGKCLAAFSISNSSLCRPATHHYISVTNGPNALYLRLQVRDS